MHKARLIACYSPYVLNERTTLVGTTEVMHKARLDDGDMWPSEFAVLRWSDEVAARIEALVKAAAA